MNDPRYDQLFDQHILARMAIERAIEEAGGPLPADHPAIQAAARAIRALLPVIEPGTDYPPCPDCHGMGVDGEYDEDTGVAGLSACNRCIDYGYNGPYSNYNMKDLWPGWSSSD